MTIKRPNPYAISTPIDARIDYLVIAQVNRNVTLIINDVAALIESKLTGINVLLWYQFIELKVWLGSHLWLYGL